MGGFCLFANNNAYTRGGGLGNVNHIFTKEELSEIDVMSEVEQDNFYRKLAWDYIFKNYQKMPKLMVRKLVCLWDIFQTYYDNGMKRIYNIWYTIIFMFSLFGIIKTIRAGWRTDILLLLSMFLYISFMALIFGGDSRFRYYAEPYLIIFASVGIFSILGRSKNKYMSFSIISFIVGINVVFYIYSDSVLNFVRTFLWPN